MVAGNPLRLDRRHGRAPYHLLALPGLVPDGPEAWLRQRRLFAAHGSTAIASWSCTGFDLGATLAAIDAEIDGAVAAGRRPILAAMSFGGGVALEWLRRRQETGRDCPLAALLLISPMGSIRDLAPMLTRLLQPIADAVDGAGGDPCVALERGRTFFRQLALRSVDDAPAAAGWRMLLGPFSRAAFAARRDRALRDRITAGLAAIPATAALARVAGMRRLRGLTERGAPLCEAPTLVLWGSKERHTLDMDGPSSGRLCRPDLAMRVFPDCEVQWVYDADGAPVPHASTLRHAGAFNRHLARFLARAAPRREMPGLHALLPFIAGAARLPRPA